MSLRLTRPLRSLVPGAIALAPLAPALAHSGHGAPAVHAHLGSPALLAGVAIVLLGGAATAALAYRFLRRRRLARRH
ncbi:MAG: hypothetical protein ACLFRS_00500 [Halomonas sp.]